MLVRKVGRRGRSRTLALRKTGCGEKEKGCGEVYVGPTDAGAPELETGEGGQGIEGEGG